MSSVWDGVRERVLDAWGNVSHYTPSYCLQTYGAVLAPPMAPDELADLETWLGVSLPWEYRSFLLEVSAGGIYVFPVQRGAQLPDGYRRRASLSFNVRLFDELIGHLTANGACLVHGISTDDPDTLAWCLHRGFSAQPRAALLLARPDRPGHPSARTDAARQGPHRVGGRAQTGGRLPVDAAAIADEPGDVQSDHVPYDQWVTEVWQNPDTDLDLSTVVLIDDVPAAWTRAVTDRVTHRVWAGGTGTLREHRGKGSTHKPADGERAGADRRGPLPH